MPRVFRRDIASGPPAAPVRMPNGWLRVDARAARVGIQEYTDESGKVIRELRIPEEVFKPESMASFAMVPVTNDHPPVLLDAANAAQYSKGHTGQDIRQDGDWMIVPMMITDAATIADVERGKSQVSNGYECDLDASTPNNPEYVAKWGPYDRIQRDIGGNHVAIVDAARAGPEARVRLDSAGNALLASAPTQAAVPPQESHKMPSQIRIDGLPLDLTEGNAPAIQAAHDRAVKVATEKTDAALREANAKLAETAKKLDNALTNGGKLLNQRKAIKVAWDAVKAKMIGCDECAGTGKVPGTDGKETACDYCDGAGSIRMHSPIVAKAGEKDADEEMEEALEGEEMDQDELSVEQETEKEAGAAHTDARKRLDAKRRTRQDAAADFAKERAASIDRMVARRMDARRVLEGTARKFVPAETDLVKLDDNGVKLAVIKALAPTAKMDGKTPADVHSRYMVEVERAEESGTTTTAHEDSAPAARQIPVHTAARNDEFASFIPDPEAARAKLHSNRTPAAK